MDRGVAHKRYDFGVVMDLRLGCVAFPVHDGHHINPNPLGYLPLVETELFSFRPDMLA